MTMQQQQQKNIGLYKDFECHFLGTVTSIDGQDKEKPLRNI